MRRIGSDSGESLVEVLVSMLIFMMMVAVMQGAISFCTNAQHKSEQIRKNNAAICEQAWAAAPTAAGGTASFQFTAVSADGSLAGTTTLFEVEAQLGEKKVSYTDAEGGTKEYTFYVYMEKPGTPAGPGTPEGTGGGSP